MSYNVVYKGSFVNVETDIDNLNNQKQIDIYIYDTDSGTADLPTAVIPLEMADEPLIIENVNNAEDKFEPIISKRCDIKIFSSDSITIETFSEGGDRRYLFEIYYDSILKLTGYLTVSDDQQDFLPDPNVIVLTGSCGLNSLINFPLVDFDGNVPLWEERIISFFEWALNNTGLQLNISFSFNIRERFSATLNSDDSGDGHFSKWLWLLSKTFEDDINTRIDCLAVMRRLLGRDGKIIQRNGEWLVCRVDEMENRDYYIFTFDYQGNFISKSQVDFTKSVGEPDLLSWMNDDCVKSNERAIKTLELNFGLNLPKELLQNYDLSRGTAIDSTTITPDEWVLEQSTVPAGLTPPALSATPNYIKLTITDGESERFLHMDATAISVLTFWRNKSKIYGQAGDKVEISLDWRYTSAVGGSGHYHLPQAQLRLYGNDGSHWTANIAGGIGSSDPQSYWLLSDADWITNNRFLYHDGEFGLDDLSMWQTTTGKSAPLPIGGQLELYLVHNFQTNVRGKDFTAISFDIKAYIAGTYDKYTGQQYNISQALKTVEKIKDDVFIGCTFNKNFKGTILKVGSPLTLYTGNFGVTAPNSILLPFGSGYLNYLFTVGKKITTTGTNTDYYTIKQVIYHTIPDQTELIIRENNLITVAETGVTINELGFDLVSELYTANVFPDGVPDETYYHPYGHLQLYDVWNQYNRVMSKFEGTIDHLDTGNDILDPADYIILTDPDKATNGKRFMIVHAKSDLHVVSSQVFLHEVFDENIPKDYSASTFKYIT